MAVIFDSTDGFDDNNGYEVDDWEGSDYVEEYAPAYREGPYGD